MNTTINKQKNTFSKNDIYPLIEGVDFFINLSLVTYLCSYFLPEIELRLSILIITSLALFSYFSKLFIFRISSFVKKKIEKINISLCLLFAYLLVIISPSGELSLLSIIIFLLSRFIIGNCFALTYLSQSNQNFRIEKLKYWFLFLLGLILGSIVLFLVNETFSNSDLNNWAWKIIYLFNLILIFSTFIFFFKNEYYKLDTINQLLIDNTKKYKAVKLLQIIHLIIPFFAFVLFASSEWLPKFSNPNNMQFLQYDFVFLFLTIMLTIFIIPLSNLIGKKKSTNFFFITAIVISFCCIFFEHSSSYSIDLAKLFLSLFSSFSLCLFVIGFDRQKLINALFKFNSFNLITSTLIIIIPMIFYAFLNFSISYNILYLLFTIIMTISYVSHIYGKR
jgi:MFS family permease